MKKIIIILSCCTIFLLLGYVGYRGYKVWKQEHLMSMARAFMAKPDQRSAGLCLRQILKLNPWHLEATRMMADIATSERSPSALIWRSRVVELNPHSLNDRLALAQVALAFNDYSIATNALQEIDAEGKKTAAYHNDAGALAITLGQLTEAEAHFAEAVRIQPTNPAPRLNLAVVRLHGTNEAILAEARSALREIVTNPAEKRFRCAALRELLTDAARFKQPEAALALSKELIEDTNSVFSDRLLRLNVLGATTNAEFKTALEDFQHEAVSKAHVYELGMWQMARLSPAYALSWLQTLPMQTQTNLPVNTLIADCKSATQDWPGLQQWAAGQRWAELEFTRHAFLSRSFREQGMDGTSKGEWELAVKSASAQKASTMMLLRFAARWNWQSEAEELLWNIVDRYPQEKWASQALLKSLVASGRTRSVMKLCSQELKRSPSDLAAKNNLAVTALLLDAQEIRPHDLAQQVYEKSPTNASFASTYAFSLYLKKKNQDALKVIETLPPKDLEKQSIAGYYALILKAAGNNQKASAFFEYAFKGPLLPEEKKLFQSARNGA